MRNHYEETALDPRKDVGAESSGSPFRVRPITWKQGNSSYVNERTVGTQQASWNFVAQLRGWLPAPIGGLIWFGVDDATFSIHTPFHGGTKQVPHSFADGTGNALHFSTESAFWAFNSVANFIYPRWFAAADVIKRAKLSEARFAEELLAEETQALELYQTDPAKALDYLTASDVARADKLVKDEFALFGELMVTYRDGFHISSPGPNPPDHGGAQGGLVPKVEEVGYDHSWYARIVHDTGDHYKVAQSLDPELERSKIRAINKGISGTWQPKGERAVDAVII